MLLIKEVLSIIKFLYGCYILRSLSISIFMCDIYYFAYLSEKVYEGGMARNYAFFIKFKSITENIFNVYSKNKIIRLLKFFKIVIILLFLRKKKIVIHQGSILVLFPIFLFKVNIFRFLIKWFLIFISKRNKLFIEINDLPYEQAIDLELDIRQEFVFFEDMVYSLKEVNFIFASNLMRDFINLKYGIELSFTQVIINGGPELEEKNASKHDVFKDKDKIKFIYAGSLNPGRNLNDIILLFKEKSNFILILIGNDGVWLEDYLLPENVLYLGNFEEQEAHRITSLCDIGLLPYDSNKFYYNLCYPTKVSFYITAGIPVLSTPLKELQEVFKDSSSIDFVNFNEWEYYLDSIDFMKLKRMKNNTQQLKEKYKWSAILDSLRINDDC